MMKYTFILVILLYVSTAIHAQTNIIFIESDDQSNLAVGAYGYGGIKTPHIDKLAASGTYFTNAYNMGCWSPAVCVPSRTMLMNGTYLWKASKITADNVPGLSLTERLNEIGYNTYFTGKWHALGKKPKAIFDTCGTILPGQLKTYNSPKGHYTDIVGNEAVAFIKDAAKKKKPFFLYVAFNAPHVPRQTAQKYYDLYPAKDIKLPPSVKDGTALHPHIKYNYTSEPMQSSTMRKRYQQNNAMVTHMDERIGDIIESLKNNGLYEDSIIVFTSDHGISFGENGVAGKVCIYDVSAKAPLIIKGPDIPKNIKNKERVYLQDVYPTLLDMIGLEIPDYIDYKSLKALMLQGGKSPHESIYLAMFNDQRGIVKDNYKLILYPKGKAAELYNLTKDPWETKNLVFRKKLKNRIKEMSSQLQLWQKETGDELNLKLTFPQYF